MFMTGWRVGHFPICTCSVCRRGLSYLGVLCGAVSFVVRLSLFRVVDWTAPVDSCAAGGRYCAVFPFLVDFGNWRGTSGSGCQLSSLGIFIFEYLSVFFCLHECITLFSNCCFYFFYLVYVTLLVVNKCSLGLYILMYIRFYMCTVDIIFVYCRPIYYAYLLCYFTMGLTKIIRFWGIYA